MISIYNFKEHREFLRAAFAERSPNGRGQAGRLANAIGIHSTLMSQILSGVRLMTLEQASATAEYLGLNEDEADYFVLLVELSRAGTNALKKLIERRLRLLKAKVSNASQRLSADRTLSDPEKAVFYSDWVYSAVRQMIAMRPADSVEEYSRSLSVPEKRIRDVIQFLIGANLVLNEKTKLKIGPKSTHLDRDSPWVNTHHRNWRLKAIEALQATNLNHMHYSAPMTLSATDAEKVRELLLKTLESIDRVVEPSPSEQFFCLNMDWFRVY